MADAPPTCTLSLEPLLDTQASTADNFVFREVSTASQPGLAAILQLNAPMVVARSLAHQLQALSSDKAASVLTPALAVFESQDTAASVQTWLLGQHCGLDATRVCNIELGGHVYSFAFSAPPPGSLVDDATVLKQIRVTHPQQVVKVLALLRQQCTFSALLLSCAEARVMAHPNACAFTFEVTSRAPTELSLVGLRPNSLDFFTIHIMVAVGGHITTEVLQNADQPPLANPANFTTILQQSLSIPQAVHAVLNNMLQTSTPLVFNTPLAPSPPPPPSLLQTDHDNLVVPATAVFGTKIAIVVPTPVLVPVENSPYCLSVENSEQQGIVSTNQQLVSTTIEHAPEESSRHHGKRKRRFSGPDAQTDSSVVTATMTDVPEAEEAEQPRKRRGCSRQTSAVDDSPDVSAPRSRRPSRPKT